MGLAVAGARTAFAALPRLLLLRACCLLFPSGAAPSGPALRLRLRTSSLGETRALPRVLACCPSLRVRRCLLPVFQPSALPLPPRFGTPFRHPEPVFPVCIPPFPKRASARWNWFHCILFSPVRLVNFRFQISALRRFSSAPFPSRQGRCCASSLSRTSAKMRSYPQAAHSLVDNFASCEKCLEF